MREQEVDGSRETWRGEAAQMQEEQQHDEVGRETKSKRDEAAGEGRGLRRGVLMVLMYDRRTFNLQGAQEHVKVKKGRSMVACETPRKRAGGLWLGRESIVEDGTGGERGERRLGRERGRGRDREKGQTERARDRQGEGEEWREVAGDEELRQISRQESTGAVAEGKGQ
eukprot:751219-Hanusia_phi.AAC.3